MDVSQSRIVITLPQSANINTVHHDEVVVTGNIAVLDGKVSHQHHRQFLVDIATVGTVEQGLEIGPLALIGRQGLGRHIGKTR